MPGAAVSPKERLRWADLAKGCTMLLVVLWHVHVKHYMDLDWVIDLPVRRGWIELHSLLVPVRMPLFFAISGMFAAAALSRPWGQVALRRIASPYYLYALWVAISAAVYNALQSDIDYLLLATIWELPAKLLVPTGTLWYVYALATYFLLAKLLRNLPVWVVLPTAGLVSAAAAAHWIPGIGMSSSILRHFVFFLAGAYLPELLRRTAARAGQLQLALASVAYAGMVLAYVLNMDRTFGVAVIAGFIAIWFGVLVVVRLSRWDALSSVGAYIGRNTLPIFVLHVPLIALVRWLAEGPAADLWAPVLRNDVVAGIYPLVVAMVIIAMSLLIHRLLLRAGAWWLFGLTDSRARPEPGVPPPGGSGAVRPPGAKLASPPSRVNGSVSTSGSQLANQRPPARRQHPRRASG